MFGENSKNQEMEIQYAAVLAAVNLAMFVSAVIAVGGLIWCLTRLSEFVAAFKMFTVIALLIFGGVFAAQAQTASDEQVLRELIKREAAGRQVIKYTENAVLASDAMPRPVILEKEINDERLKTLTVSVPRRNQILKIKVRRIVVAESKDIACEYSDFSLVYDQPDTTRDGYTGSLLRVWHKTKSGEWRVDAAFARQNAQGDDDDKPDFQKNDAPVGSTVKLPFYMTRLP